MNIPTTTEMLRNDVLEIGQQLREGKLSNAVARTLLIRAKIALDTLRSEMEAARLGCDFSSIEMSEASRNKKTKLRSVA